jgi:hypothetical protein
MTKATAPHEFASTAPTPIEDRPLVRHVAILTTAIVLGFWVLGWIEILQRLDDARPALAADYRFYVDAAARWLNTGQFYTPYQLTGPYSVQLGVEVLYPPAALLLFVPFTILPAILWWAIPVTLMAWGIWRLRPVALVWPVMALCLLPATEQFWAGNTGIWLAAGVALATSFGWPSVVCFIKPTLFLFAGVGAWRRSWWIAVAVLIAVSLPFGSMWIDYVHVGLNARYSGGGLAYSAYEIPLLLIPIAAWIGSREGPLLSRRRGGIEVNTLDDDVGRPSAGAASSADEASEDVPHQSRPPGEPGVG